MDEKREILQRILKDLPIEERRQNIFLNINNEIETEFEEDLGFSSKFNIKTCPKCNRLLSNNDIDVYKEVGVCYACSTDIVITDELIRRERDTNRERQINRLKNKLVDLREREIDDNGEVVDRDINYEEIKSIEERIKRLEDEGCIGDN